jgi:hypothetical protein
MRWNFRLSLAVLAMGSSSMAAESISDELAKLKGQPVGNVTARLGNPESQQWGQSGTTYLWTYSARVEHAPITRSQTEYSSGRPSTYETRGYSQLPLTQSCRLQVVADSVGTIAEATHSGPNAACASMVQKLAAP